MELYYITAVHGKFPPRARTDVETNRGMSWQQCHCRAAVIVEGQTLVVVLLLLLFFWGLFVLLWLVSVVVVVGWWLVIVVGGWL